MAIALYETEFKDGVAERVWAAPSVQAYAQVLPSEPFEVGDLVELVAHAKKQLSRATNEGQPDLFYLKTLLVSTGWNKNDDVFAPEEVWSARKTPEDKPVNYEHDGAEIIGHMTGCYVIDDASKVVADDTAADKLPEAFHIVTPAVLYKYWEKSKLQERMDQLLAGIAKGEWFVSMEALFTGFDYALVAGKTQKVVARNADTAFLTKHLRAYGGDGTYEGQKVGRLLRGLVFSGKGMVKNPANPPSVVLEADNVKAEQFPKISPRQHGPVYFPLAAHSTSPPNRAEESTMSPKTELEMLQQLAAELKADNDKLRTELSKSAVSEWQAKLAKAEADLAEAQKSLEDVTAQLSVSDEALQKTKAEIDALTAKLSEYEKAAQMATKAHADLLAEMTAKARAAKVKDKLKLDDQKAAAFVQTTQALTEEQFDAVLASYPVNLTQELPNNGLSPQKQDVPAPPPPKSTPAPAAPQSTGLPAPAKAGKESDPAEGNADPANLDGAKPEPAAAGSVPASPAADALRAQVAKFFGCEIEADE
jgi:hypothetical protein